MKLLKHRAGHQESSFKKPSVLLPFWSLGDNVYFPSTSVSQCVIWKDWFSLRSLPVITFNVCLLLLFLFCLWRELGRIFLLPHFQFILWLGQRTELISFYLHGENNTHEQSTSHKCGMMRDWGTKPPHSIKQSKIWQLSSSFDFS